MRPSAGCLYDKVIPHIVSDYSQSRTSSMCVDPGDDVLHHESSSWADELFHISWLLCWGAHCRDPLLHKHHKHESLHENLFKTLFTQCCMRPSSVSEHVLLAFIKQYVTSWIVWKLHRWFSWPLTVKQTWLVLLDSAASLYVHSYILSMARIVFQDFWEFLTIYFRWTVNTISIVWIDLFIKTQFKMTFRLDQLLISAVFHYPSNMLLSLDISQYF